MTQPVIRLKDVRHAYTEGGQERTVLGGVSLEVAPGELLAIVGRSGSGKSTLLNVIGGIDRVESGEVLVAGQRLDQQSERDRTLFRRRHVGFVFQFFNLIPTLTIEENAMLHLEMLGRADKAGRARVHQLLDQVGLLDRLRSWPDRLSGGEQQRVAVVAALAHEPDVVLADEPTGNLDEASEATIVHLLDTLTRGLGRTLVLVTHSESVASIADRVVTMEDHIVIPGPSRGAPA